MGNFVDWHISEMQIAIHWKIIRLSFLVLLASTFSTLVLLYFLLRKMC